MDLYKYKDDSENKKNVLRIIYDERGVSRSELVEKTGLSLATITKFVGEFINDGVVEESGTLESTGGRKSSILAINSSFAYVIGIDIGAYSTKLGVVRINGEIAEKHIFPASHTVPAKGISIEELCIKIDSLLSKYNRDRFIGIGVGVSGMVNPQKGKIIFCPNITDWDSVNVVEILEKRFGLPVYLDTSSRCMALAEQWFGIGKGIKNQVFMSIGYSVGAGIIIDSRIFRGSGGFSGEIGHVQVNEEGRRCTCGNYGCLEMYVTMPMIIEKIMRSLKDFNGYSPIKAMLDNFSDINKDIVKEAFRSGDKIVYEALMDAGKCIGIVLSSMVNILNLELIVLGGGVIENFPVIVDKVERTIKERALVTVQQNLTVRKTSLGWDSSVTGSSILLISKFLE